MEKEINLFEKLVLEEIINFNKGKYAYIKDHIPYLRVKSRKYTGVGLYITFEYLLNHDLVIDFDQNDVFLSSNKYLELDALKYGLNYELNISNGKIEFLELVTNGESWNGECKDYRFVSPDGA